MQVDRVFFKNVVHILKTNHNLIRNRDDITETWKASVDATIHQCEEMLKVAQFQEERNAVFAGGNEMLEIDIEDVRLYRITADDLEQDEE